MNMIGHQHVVQDTHPGESLLASHEREKTPGGQTPLERRAEDEEATDKPGNAVINSRTLTFDTWKTHNWSHSTQQKIKMNLKFEFYLNILTCPFRFVPLFWSRRHPGLRAGAHRGGVDDAKGRVKCGQTAGKH